MNYTMRQFLKDLFQAFQEKANAANLDVKFEMVEDVLDGGFRFTSTLCPFTFITPSQVSDWKSVNDLYVQVFDDNASVETLEEDAVEGPPTLRLPMGSIVVADENTWKLLYGAMVVNHPYRASLYLNTFTLNARNTAGQ